MPRCIHSPVSPSSTRLRPLAALVPLIASLAYATVAHAAPPLPSGGQFVAGSGSIGGGGQSLTINQTTSRGVIDWNSFSIGSGRQVTFNNGSGATLNRVTGGDASVLLGQLSASGSVYLVNPQGVLVGPGGVVATGGRFVASALDVGDAAFMQGGPLTLAGGGNGMVINLGKIGSSGGDVFLVSRTAVINAGTISAPQGTAELASGSQVLLQDASGGQQVFVQAGSGGSVMNAGAIQAAQASLQAADGNVYALAGNSAAIRATGTATRDGHVWLVADQGAVHANGSIAAANADGSGGSVETHANALDVAGADVHAGNWTLGAPALTVDQPTGTALARSLANGTSVVAQSSSGDLAVNGSVQWTGNGSLTLNAAHSVSIGAGSTLANSGNGNLTLRADSAGADNGGSVTNGGTIDWSKSGGIVSALYDMNGSYAPGTVLTNSGWTAAQYSGLVTQATGYKFVNTLADLKNVSQDLAGNYALGKDIDASATAYPNYFTPIGQTTTAPFTGQFDGFGHTIDQLATAADLDNDYFGMFGVIGTKGVVRDLNLTNGNTGGNTSGGLGLLVGQNNGYVTYVNTTGSVSQNGFGGFGAGGVAGVNNGTIARSSSTADVGYQTAAGGLVGVNNGTIAQSYATGFTRGGTHGNTGGLVAFNSGLITQSYATGGVGGFGGGGLVYSNGTTGVINESFATGQVGGGGPPGDPEGGIAGYNTGAIHNNVYWNRDTTIRTTAAASNSGTAPPDSNGLSTAQMSNASNYLDWNIPAGGVWAMPAGATHPILQWQQAH
ncbi:filamentous hemagglutinin N-terminal domain-containing protein [Caballeronia sp. LZ032]|uniref:beta strand repeat-containing protein n=1 Tax=Caballeronia sp. LZ032 TaxID=3038565 RepID=UPI002864EBDE|nr:filamentous hemagglutinin N-terminal domain-containing protein [Caballeronia sp. LZ032]MDR5880928.1 filamentous hemagglutinin N-terminal domain-containing protein [Caballeronia sp. LZ032]